MMVGKQLKLGFQPDYKWSEQDVQLLIKTVKENQSFKTISWPVVSSLLQIDPVLC